MLKYVRRLLFASALVLLPASVAAQQSIVKPLIIVDGIVIGGDTVATQLLRRIPPDDIQSINVIKGPVATELYGARASGGVIIIRTKAGADATPLTEGQRQWTEFLTQLRATDTTAVRDLRLRNSVGAAQPLIVVDGVIVGRGNHGGLDALRDRIESISILKGAAAITAYGAAAADGVIIITTK